MFKTVLQKLLFLLISLLFLTGCDDINVATNIQEGASLTKNDQTIIFETDHGDAKDVLDLDKRVLTVNGVDRTDNTVTENENIWNIGPLRVVYQPVAPQLLPEGNVSIILTIPSKGIYTTASDFYTKELHIFVDTLAPTIEALTPKNNTTITDPLTPLIFDIHDNINGSGLDESSVKITFTDTNTSHMLVFDANSNTYRYLPSVTEPFALGNIAFTVYAKDQIGNDASFAGTVTLIDVIPPVLTLNGEANITLEQNAVYEELGATASDERDGNVSVTITGNVDTSMVGTYTVTYTAQDSIGNEASITRTVNVVAPVLTSISLESNATTINIGEKAELTVTGTYSDNSTKELTSNIEWIITPLDSVEVNGTVLTVKKDGSVTVQAKVETIVSNTLNLTILWVVNGHVLPPEPDPTVNNSTLVGIDMNDNGVRDDVERWIYKTYKDKHPIYIDIAMQAAKGYKLVLETPERAKEIYNEVDKAAYCEGYYKYEAEYFNEPTLVHEDIDDRYFRHKIYFNTKERMDAYIQYDTLLSGDSYTLPDGKAMKAMCDFNTSKYGE